MALEAPARADERFALFAILWTIRNRARGAAGRANVAREFTAALAPLPARLALAAADALMRLLASTATPIYVHPVPCRSISDDERRIVQICRALWAGDNALAGRVAAELVGPDRAEELAGHVHTLLLALRESGGGAQPLPGRAAAAPLRLH